MDDKPKTDKNIRNSVNFSFRWVLRLHQDWKYEENSNNWLICTDDDEKRDIIGTDTNNDMGATGTSKTIRIDICNRFIGPIQFNIPNIFQSNKLFYLKTVNVNIALIQI